MGQVIVPAMNAQEAACIEGIDVVGVDHLSRLIAHMSGLEMIGADSANNVRATRAHAHVRSFTRPRPRARKTRVGNCDGRRTQHSHERSSGFRQNALARTLSTILPAPQQEALEVTSIHSVAGRLKQGYVSQRPFRAPHHTASGIALIGGGSKLQPGEISLAHRGVLFLDEIAEFPSHVLEELRQPLEEGTVTISRALPAP